MCGIAGIVSCEPVQDLEARLRRMQASLLHRGPDDRDVRAAPDGRAGLAHTRLAIIDLSAAARQPMASQDGRLRIVLNGEIYNYRQIRADLEAQGMRFRTSSDTEVLLAAYAKHGPRCVDLLRGMFAFAIRDELEGTLFLARDPFGIKPLYYGIAGTTLVFASEVRAMLESGLFARRLCPRGLHGYLVSGSVPEPWTIVDNLRMLPAGCTALWDGTRLSVENYWDVGFNACEMEGGEAVERTRRALGDSIAHHFVSDVPVGVFLSGGIDSTAIVAIARKQQDGPLHTFSIGIEGGDGSEAPLARQTAVHFGTRHSEQVLTADGARQLFDTFRENVDQPTIDGFNTFCISSFARAEGVKVCLSGLGGDELFNGYPSFQKARRIVRWRSRLGALHGVGTMGGRVLERTAPTARLRRMGAFLQEPNAPASVVRLLRGVFSNREARELVAHFSGAAWEEAAAEPAHPRPDAEVLDEVSAHELTWYMRNQLLRDSDVMSMAVGLELRVPLVDRMLFEEIRRIPARHRLARGKALLVQAVPELPPWVLNRPKRGFLMPFDRWFRDAWTGMFPALPRRLDIPLTSWYRRWSVGLLQSWMARNGFETPSDR